MQDLLLMLLLTLGGTGRPAGASSDLVPSASPATAPSILGTWRGEWSTPARHGTLQARLIRGVRPGTAYAELTQEDGGAARVTRVEGRVVDGGTRFEGRGGKIVMKLVGNDRLEGTLPVPQGATFALSRPQP